MNKFLLLLTLLACARGASAQLTLKTEKGDFNCRFIGRALFDFGVFADDKTELGNSVDLYDVRLGAVLDFTDNFGGKIELGFVNNKVSLKDVYLDFRKGSHLVILGHYFEYFALGARIGSSDMKFNGYTATDQAFGDRRKFGLSYAYKRERWDLCVGVFDDKDAGSSADHRDEGYVVATRAQYRPLIRDGRVIHAALSSRFYKLGGNAGNRLSYTAGAPSTLVRHDFLRADLTDATSEWKYAADVVMTLDRWYAQAEYLHARVKRLDGAEPFRGEGGYAQIGYALLGGRYAYNLNTGMASSTGPGSLEVLCRYNFTDMNDRKAGVMGGRQRDISVGAAYYFNKYVAVKASYTNVSLDKHSPVAGKQSFDMVQGRIQVSF